MLVTNRHIHHGLIWEDYLALPGTSFSGLSDKRPDNMGIRIGSLVHKYILKPGEYNYEHPEIVRPIANELIKFTGHSLIMRLACETAVTATFTEGGFYFFWKGMPDMFLLDSIVFDFKIINGSLANYLKRFNYKGQITGYMLGTNAKKGIIIAYNKIRKKIEIAIFDLEDTRFWDEIVITRGSIL